MVCVSMLSGTADMLPLKNLALDDDGLDMERGHISFCSPCFSTMERRRIPQLSLKNGLEFGRVPKVLRDLTWAEQRLIAIYNVHLHMVHFRNHHTPGEKLELDPKHHQPHFKGTAFCVPQDTVSVLSVLPPPPSTLPDIIQVLCAALLCMTLSTGCFSGIYSSVERSDQNAVRAPRQPRSSSERFGLVISTQ